MAAVSERDRHPHRRAIRVPAFNTRASRARGRPRVCDRAEKRGGLIAQVDDPACTWRAREHVCARARGAWMLRVHAREVGD